MSLFWGKSSPFFLPPKHTGIRHSCHRPLPSLCPRLSSPDAVPDAWLPFPSDPSALSCLSFKREPARGRCLQANGTGLDTCRFLVLTVFMSQFFCHRSAKEALLCCKRNYQLCHNLWKAKSLHLCWQEYSCSSMKREEKCLFPRKVTFLYHTTNAVFLRIKNEAQTLDCTIKLNSASSSHRKLLPAPGDSSLWTMSQVGILPFLQLRQREPSSVTL